MSQFAVILPAAGKSSRFGDKEKKPFANLDGRAVWLRTAELFVNRKDVCQMILVIAAEDQELFERRYRPNIVFLNIKVVLGGPERWDSVARALEHVNDQAEFVAVHDAVRPCVTPESIDAVFAAARQHGAAILATPIPDTIKKVDSSKRIEATVSREGLWLAQTPQVFRRDWLCEAYARRSECREKITDDALLVEAMGKPVYVVNSPATNIKITTRADLALAEAVLKSRPDSRPNRPAHPFADEAEMWGGRPTRRNE